MSSRLCLAALLGSLVPFAAGCDSQLASPSAVSASPSAAAPPPAIVELTLVGTSDLHGRLAALPLLGGALRVLRSTNPGGVILVDAGDMFQGTLESNLGEGAAVIEGYKKLGYDAVAIGNHEFDYGPVGPASTVRKNAKEGADSDPRGALKARSAQARGSFPFLAANLTEDGHPVDWPNVFPSVIVTKKGIAVGIIGLTSTETPSTTIAANVGGIAVSPLVSAIVTEAKALRDRGAKLIIVTAHAGGECSKLDVAGDLSSCDATSEIFEVARALPPDTVQAIVAGHTHKAIAQEVAGIPIIQSNAYGTTFGEIDFVVDGTTGKVLRTKIHAPIPTPVAAGAMFEGVAIEPSREVQEAVGPAIAQASARRGDSLTATLAGPFPAKYRDESALGNLLTSLLLELEPRADLAIANGGGLRADLPIGPLLYGSVYDALPFDNRLARMTMSGRALRETVTRNLSGKSGILSIAGARISGHCEAGKLAVDIVLTGKKKPERKLADSDHVLIVTNDFLATQGDGFGPGEKVEIDEDGPPFREPLAALLKKRGGELKPTDWFDPARPRIKLPGPIGPTVCGP